MVSFKLNWLRRAILPPHRLLSAKPLAKLPSQPAAPTIAELIYASDAIQLRERLAAEKQLTIPWTTYVETCASLDISPARARRLAEDLQHSGLLLHMDDSVCVRPKEIIAHMLTPEAKAVLAKANKLNDGHDTMHAERSELEARARTTTRRIMLGFGVGLAVQAAVLFRLTFWDLGWDIIEPATYFLNMGTMLGWYFFFAVMNREAAYMNMDTYVYEKVRERLYSRSAISALSALKRKKFV